jgi:peptidoglycan/LPS O-acetylase OafA/YrhL
MTSQGRLAHLDVLRGIAAMMVVLAHFIERTPLKDNVFFTFVNLGQIGVVLFFLLSGMVIPYSLKEGKHALVAFAISRFFRLYPAYWFSIALAVISSYWFLSTGVSLKVLAANLTMFQAVFRVPDLFGVYWTLIIEMFFYILCAGLFGFGLLSRASVRFKAAVGLLVLAFIFSVARYYLAKKIPVAVPLCMSIMFFGSFWREASLGCASKEVRRYIYIWMALFVVFLPFICLLSYSNNYGYNENPYAYFVSYTIGMMFGVVMTLYFRLSIKILSYLGAISYSTYLIHPFFLEWAAHWVDLSAEFNVGVFLIYILATLTLSSISYSLIEKPCVSLGRRLNLRLQAGFENELELRQEPADAEASVSDGGRLPQLHKRL